MKIIALTTPNQLPHAPLRCYTGCTAEDAAHLYRARYGREVETVYRYEDVLGAVKWWVVI